VASDLCVVAFLDTDRLPLALGVSDSTASTSTEAREVGALTLAVFRGEHFQFGCDVSIASDPSHDIFIKPAASSPKFLSRVNEQGGRCLCDGHLCVVM
jgi:hypothetical protein